MRATVRLSLSHDNRHCDRRYFLSLHDRVAPETVVFGFCLARTGNLFGIDEVSGSPITLDESPRARDVHGVPTVPESVVLEANARLVARRLAVTLDDHAMQASVAANT